MNTNSREILYCQLLEMSKLNLKEDAKSLISEEEFNSLSDVECFKYTFWYRDTQTRFEDDYVYVIELPDINLEGKDLSRTYLSFFKIGVLNNDKKADDISSINLRNTGAIVNLSTVLFNIAQDTGSIIDDSEFFDFSKCDLKGCILYGLLKGENKRNIPILGEENLDDEYVHRRNNFDSEEAKIADRVYDRLMQGVSTSRVRGIKNGVSLADYEFAGLSKEQRKLIEEEIKDKKVDVFYSDLYQKYGIINSYSIEKNSGEYVYRKLIKNYHEYQIKKDENAYTKGVRDIYYEANMASEPSMIASSLYNRIKAIPGRANKKAILDFVNYTFRTRKSTYIDSSNEVEENNRNLYLRIIDDAIEQATTKEGIIYRRFLYRSLGEGNIADEQKEKIFNLAHLNDEEELLRKTANISESNILIQERELNRYYELKALGDIEGAQKAIDNVKRWFGKDNNQSNLEQLLDIMIARKDDELLNEFFKYATDGRIIDKYLELMYSSDDKVSESIRKAIEERIEACRKKTVNSYTIKYILNRAEERKDFDLLKNNFDIYRKLCLENQEESYLNKLMKMAYKANTDESEKYKDYITTLMDSKDSSLSKTMKSRLANTAVLEEYKEFAIRYYRRISETKLREKFIENELDRYDSLVSEEERKQFLQSNLTPYFKEYGDLVIEIFARRILKRNRENKELVNSKQENDILREFITDDTIRVLSTKSVDAILKLKDKELTKSALGKMDDFSKLKYRYIPDSEAINIINRSTSIDDLKGYLKYREKEYFVLANRKDSTDKDNIRMAEIRNTIKSLLLLQLGTNVDRELITSLFRIGDYEDFKRYINIFSAEQKQLFAQDLISKIDEMQDKDSKDLVSSYISIIRSFEYSNNSERESRLIHDAMNKKKYYFLRTIFPYILQDRMRLEIYNKLLEAVYVDKDNPNSLFRRFAQINYKCLDLNRLETDRIEALELITQNNDFDFFRDIPNLSNYQTEYIIAELEEALHGKKNIDTKNIVHRIRTSKMTLIYELRTLKNAIISQYKERIKDPNLDKKTLSQYKKALAEILITLGPISNYEELWKDEELLEEMKKNSGTIKLLEVGMATDDEVRKLVIEEKRKAREGEGYSGKLLYDAILGEYPTESILQLIENGSNVNYYDVLVCRDYPTVDEYRRNPRKHYRRQETVKVKMITPVICQALDIRDLDKRKIVVKSLLKAGANPDKKSEEYRDGETVKAGTRTARQMNRKLIEETLEEIEAEKNSSSREKIKLYSEGLNISEEEFTEYDNVFYEFSQKANLRRSLRLSDYSLVELQQKKAIFDMFGLSQLIFKNYPGAVTISPEVAYNRILFITNGTRTKLQRSNFVREVLVGNKKFAARYGKILLPDEEQEESEEYNAKVRDKILKYGKMPQDPKRISKILKEIVDKEAR